MSNLEHTTSWQQIQQGVKEAERLIVNKNYNLVMVKARQTLECMVRCMAEKACQIPLTSCMKAAGSIRRQKIITIPSAFLGIRRCMKMTIQRIMPIRHTSF